MGWSYVKTVKKNNYEFKLIHFFNGWWFMVFNATTFDRSVVSSTNKTHYQDITEILLKVALNTINHQPLKKCINLNYHHVMAN
jgi:hypothetical protein